jgi:cyanate permease
LLAVGLIRDGLALGERSPFWGGMVLLVLGIISRMLEYNTGLLLKSIVFALCGVGIIAAGLWFERNVKPHQSSLPSASQETL